MDNPFLKVLQQWNAATRYDPSRTNFTIPSADYEFHRCGKMMTSIMDNYDPSGMLAVLYMKEHTVEILSNATVSVMDCIKDRHIMDGFYTLFDMLEDDAVVTANRMFATKVVRMLQMFEDQRAIGVVDTDAIMAEVTASMSTVLDDMTKLRLEIYVSGPTSSDHTDLPVCSTIGVFHTLAHALVFLEGAKDGVYVCYIAQYSSVDGYFDVIFKDGAAIYGFNDRVPEYFMGQHQASRNNRRLEDKGFELFPYNKVGEWGGSDYKGYPTKFHSVGDHIPFRTLEQSEYLPLAFAIILMTLKIAQGGLQQGVQVYTNALLPQSALRSGHDALVPINHGMLSTAYADMCLNYETQDVLDSNYNEAFDAKSSKSRRSSDHGSWANLNQTLIDLWGEGFTPTDENVLAYQRPMLTDGTSISTPLEFVTTAQGMLMESYRQYRIQLRDYIRAKMQTELDRIGGYFGVMEWYREFIFNHRERLIQWALDRYYDIKITGTEDNHKFDWLGTPLSDDPLVSIYEQTDGPKLSHPRCTANVTRGDNLSACPLTGNVAYIWVECEPCNWRNIENIFGDEVIKVLKGWYNTMSSRGYAGNSILESTDPINYLGTPLCDDYFQNCRRDRLHFAVGFSKRGLNKYVTARKQGKTLEVNGHVYH